MRKVEGAAGCSMQAAIQVVAPEHEREKKRMIGAIAAQKAKADGLQKKVDHWQQEGLEWRQRFKEVEAKCKAAQKGWCKDYVQRQ